MKASEILASNNTVANPRHELVLTNLDLIEMTVVGDKVQSLPQTVEQKHLLHIGYEALCKAAEGYKAETGVLFEVYANACIENAIVAALEQSHMASA